MDEMEIIEFENLPSNKTPINSVNLNKLQTNAKEAIKNRKPTIELLTVSSVAPSTCDVGDKYYNTTTSKIYTAIATNTWGTEGENPSNLYLYVDLEHKELYYFDGTRFVSYGGGSGGTGGDTLPIGGIIAFDSDTIPNGWLLCDGRAVSRTEYAELFKAIGTKHGSGDGSTTFNLPNPKGRTLVGKDSSDTDFNELGKTGGEKTHTLTVSELPSHSHVINSFRQYETGSSTDSSKLGRTTPGADGGNSTIATGGTGGGQAHNNLQPYLVTNFIIKAKMTVAIEGEIIQEDGTASETNVYSSVAMDNKLKTNIVTGQEVATNEYIDGKRVYVKRATFTTGSTVNTWYAIIKLSSNCNLIDFYGAITVETEQYPLINDGHSNFFQIVSKVLSHKHVNEYYNNKNGWVIAKYTKN